MVTQRVRPAERAALVALAITLALTIAKVAAWASTDSLAVLSQAVDSALDLVALALVFFAVRVAGKPADEQHHYGHRKAENLVAFTQTLLLAVVVGVWRSRRRVASRADRSPSPHLPMRLACSPSPQ